VEYRGLHAETNSITAASNTDFFILFTPFKLIDIADAEITVETGWEIYWPFYSFACYFPHHAQARGKAEGGGIEADVYGVGGHCYAFTSM